jgi:predicted NACHT family NTPase
MRKGMTQIKVFVSCPSDVKQEKQIVRDVCDSLTRMLSRSRNIQIIIIDWRRNVIPLITGESAQSVIDEQIDHDYDIYLGILWKRFGDKQSNGLTLTEGEFEEALRRKKETGKPVIQFYFKMDEFYPSNPYDAQQALEVQNFRERIKKKDLGLYGEFKGEDDFRRKMLESIGYIVENFSHLTSKKTSISKIKYPKVPYYLRRKVCPTKDSSSTGMSFLRSELSQDTLDVIEQHNRIVLLSDAGVGKTTELQRIAWHFSEDDTPFYPIFRSLNKYVNQDLSELLPSYWREIPESHLLIILDGLDEIESKNKNDAIRRIESFAEEHPSSNIVISCRTNFYNLETRQATGTLSGFSSYALLDLDSVEREKYITTRLGDRARDFERIIFRNRLQDLLKIPFYLMHLVGLFEADYALPESKANIFEQLLIARIQLDVDHFRTTVELDEKRNIIIETLERLALGMEVFGRNYITAGEYQQLIPNEPLRTLIKHCTVWKKSERDKVTWQFEHNNFQEYLAARVLSRKSLHIIMDFISFEPDHLKVIPSWVNTLSFLLSISDDRDLFNWILDNEPELAVKFEPDKIEIAIRIHIFKEIFNNYKAKQIWINRDKFRYSELAQFGQSEEIINFLLTEAETATHYTTICNAIELLGHLKIPARLRQRATRLLIGRALDGNKGEMVQNGALIALARLKLNSQRVINEIVPILRSSNSDSVRYGLYYLLHNSDYLDENIEVFIEGIEYVRLDSTIGGEIRLGGEHGQLNTGLEKAKSPEAIRKILTYFKENPRDLDDTFFERSIPIIVENAANAYSIEPLLFESALDLFTVLTSKHLEKEAGQFVCFFDKTNTRLQAFQKVFAEKRSSDDFIVLATLADAKCIEFFVQQYEEHSLTNNDIWTFQSYLGWKNHDLFLPFNRLVNEKSRNKFVIPPRRDIDGERKQRRRRDIDLLFDRQAFLNEIKLIFDTEQKQTFTSKELLEVMTHRWDSLHYSDLAIHTLHKIAGNQTVSLETAIQIVERNWDRFCISNIYEYLEHDKEIIISKEQKDWITNWCCSNLTKVDFKTALVTKPNRQFSANWLAIWLWFFLRKLNLTYRKDVLLDMLSFDWVEGSQMLGIEYLEERLNETEITARILENLQNGIQNNDVLKNHIDYCKRKHVKEALSFALREITNTDRDGQVRSVVLETVCELSETLSDLEQMLPEITDDFKWNVVEQLVKRNSRYSHKFLLEVLANGDEQEQLKAAEYLIELQDKEGLKYYVEWMRRHKQFREEWFDRSPLLSLRTSESVPFLIELLEISYQDDFVQDEFRRLDSAVLDTLTAIALQSDKQFIEVKEALELFIKEHSSMIKDVNFLYVFLERLERRYYVIKSEKPDISDVIKKLSKIYPHDC